MTRFQGGRRLLMGSAAGAMALAGALSPLLVSAQTPPAGQPAVSCAFGFEGDFAAQLAKALGKTQADVEKALAQVRAQFPPERVKAPDGAGAVVIENPHDPSKVAPAAAKLGVTPEELVAAIKAALPPLPEGKPTFQAAASGTPTVGVAPANVTPLECTPPTAQAGQPVPVRPAGQAGQSVQSASAGQSAQAGRPVPVGADAGTIVAVALNDDTFFQAIADKLGRGITAAQVKAALELVRPSGDVFTVHLLPGDQFIEALAKALGVTVDQLKAALKSITPVGGATVGGR